MRSERRPGRGRKDKGAGFKRARYNSSLLDANITEPGEEFQNLQETYVIFITENDIIGKDLPMYHINRVIEETGEIFDDGARIIYVNSQIKGMTALGMLMEDFCCTDAGKMHYSVIADRVRYFKENEEGVKTMCRAMEEMRNETIREKDRQNAIRLFGMGLSIEKIAEALNTPLEIVSEWVSKKPVVA